jgi:hypothetical protein
VRVEVFFFFFFSAGKWYGVDVWINSSATYVEGYVQRMPGQGLIICQKEYPHKAWYDDECSIN